MQIRRNWEFLGIRMTRTLQHSKQRKGCPRPANFQADQWTAFFVPPVHIGGYACFVSQSLVVLVIALSMPFSYTCLAISGKENDTMPATKNLCAQISLELHQKISDAREESGLTTAQYITNLLIEYYEMKENGGTATLTSCGSTRPISSPWQTIPASSPRRISSATGGATICWT